MEVWGDRTESAACQKKFKGPSMTIIATAGPDNQRRVWTRDEGGTDFWKSKRHFGSHLWYNNGTINGCSWMRDKQEATCKVAEYLNSCQDGSNISMCAENTHTAILTQYRHCNTYAIQTLQYLRNTDTEIRITDTAIFTQYRHFNTYAIQTLKYAIQTLQYLRNTDSAIITQ
jgi:hypothetical protein